MCVCVYTQVNQIYTHILGHVGGSVIRCLLSTQVVVPGSWDQALVGPLWAMRGFACGEVTGEHL